MTCPVIVHATGQPCGQNAAKRGMCDFHYARNHQGWPEDRLGAPKWSRMAPAPVRSCRVVEEHTSLPCPGIPVGDGLCARHYARVRAGWPEALLGSPLGTRRPRGRSTCPVVLHETGLPCGLPARFYGLCQTHHRRRAKGTADDQLGAPLKGSPRCGARTDSGPCPQVVDRFGEMCPRHAAVAAGISPRRRRIPFQARPMLDAGDLHAVHDEARELTALYGGSPAQAQTYHYQWTWFEQWAQRFGVGAQPPVPFEIVSRYLASMTDPARLDPSRGRLQPYAYGTISAARAAIRERHLRADMASPTDDVRMPFLWAGIRRAVGAEPARSVPPLTADDMVAIAGHADPADPLWARDWAFMLTAWHLRLFHADWSPLRWDSDLSREEGSWSVSIQARNVGPNVAPRQLTLVPTRDPRLCPVSALDAWREASAARPGDLAFPSRAGGPTPIRIQNASERLKLAMRRAGLGPDGYATSSLAHGYVATAISLGATEQDIRDTTGLSLRTVSAHFQRASRHADSRARDLKLRGGR